MPVYKINKTTGNPDTLIAVRILGVIIQGISV